MRRSTTLPALIHTVSRTLLALVFLFSGAVKAIDPLGTVYKIEDYLKAFGEHAAFFNDLLPMASVAAVLLILTELVLGVTMLQAIGNRTTSVLTVVFYAVMTPLTLYIALTNPVSDCGCFGDALVLSNWQTFTKNVVLIVLAILCCSFVRYSHRLFMPWAGCLITLLAVVMALSMMYYSHTHLPIVDFRPYKIGNNIPALMEYPEDAEPDVYEVSLVYEKDGHKQIFTLQDYPKGDSTWHFVRQNSKLVKKGYEPPIHDFELVDEDYEDRTYDILESEEPVTLCVMYDTEKSDSRQFEKVYALANECAQRGETFYVVTGSVESPLDLPTLHADPVTLKTIVRANPGIVVIQNGTIINKYNLKNY